jgi:hypothetical protein
MRHDMLKTATGKRTKRRNLFTLYELGEIAPHEVCLLRRTGRMRTRAST